MGNREIFEPDMEFEKLWQAVQAGDLGARSLVVEKIMPTMLQCVARRFGGNVKSEPEDAVASAIRTIERRGWEFARGRGNERELLEPRDWGDLVGILVTYAINKARTHRKKNVPSPFPPKSGDQEQSEDAWHPMEPASPPDELAMRQEMQSGLQEATNQLEAALDPMHRVILKGKLDGSSTADICKSLAAIGIHRVEASVRTAWRKKIMPEIARLMTPHA